MDNPIVPPAVGTRVFARQSFLYGYSNSQVDQGQVFEIEDVPNNEVMNRLAYFELLKPKARRHRCGVCKAEFVQEMFLQSHGEKRHPERFSALDISSMHPGDPDLPENRAERIADQEAARMPLRMDRTRATLEA